MAESREFIFPPRSRRYIEMGPVRLNTVAGAFVRNIPTINFTQGPLVSLTFEELMGGIVSVEDDSTFPALIRVILPAGSTIQTKVSYGDSFQCTVINLSTRELGFELLDSVNDTMKPRDFHGYCRALPNTATIINSVVKTDSPSVSVCYLVSTYTTKDFVKEVSLCALTGVTAFVTSVPEHPSILDIYVASENFGTWRKWCLYRWERSETWSECYPTPGMLKYVIGGTTFVGQFVMFDGVNWRLPSSAMLGITHAGLPDAGTLPHSQIDLYLNQGVTTTSTPQFSQVSLANEAYDPSNAIRLSYALKYKTASFAGSLRSVARDTARLTVVGDTEISLYYFRKDVNSGLGFSFKMPRDWSDRSGIVFYIQYMTETAREGQVYWKIWVANQHETEDTDRTLRWESFEKIDVISKVLPRELCSNRAISLEIRLDTKVGEVFTGLLRRLGTDGTDTAPDGVFLQDFGIFYYSDRFGDDAAPSY